jgi:hypothetical protein
MEQVRLITTYFNGKPIAYCSETEFLVQVGRIGRSYTRWTVFKGNLGAAVIHFNGLNVANGWQKRLLMPSTKRNKGVLARVTS